MSSKQPFALLYPPLIKAHLQAIEPKYYSLVEKEIERHLRFEPDIETRNRKPLKRPLIKDAQWELRIGPANRFRVFYKVIRETRQVYILAIGVKMGNRLFIGGEEFKS